MDNKQSIHQGWFLSLRLATYVILVAVVVFWMSFPGYLRLEFIIYSFFTLGLAVAVALGRKLPLRAVVQCIIVMQFVFEIIIDSAVIYATGNVNSPFSALFLLTIVSAALAYRLAGTLIVASLVYPALGTPTRVRDRFDRSPPVGTLDGMAYMTAGTLVWPENNPIKLEYDYEAIRWLQDNVKGTPVLAEAKIGYYREGGMRVASYTGLPLPLGGLHQNEQRWPEQVGQRDGRYMEFWNTTDPARAWELIQELDISYIYLGQLEQTLYNPHLTGSLMQWGVTFFVTDGINKFDALVDQDILNVAYENERTRIYQVIGSQ